MNIIYNLNTTITYYVLYFHFDLNYTQNGAITVYTLYSYNIITKIII